MVSPVVCWCFLLSGGWSIIKDYDRDRHVIVEHAGLAKTLGASHQARERASMPPSTLEVGNLFSSPLAHGIERQLLRVVSVGHVSVNPVSGSTTVVYDPGKKSFSTIQEAIEDCSFHRSGEAMPMYAMTTRCREGLAWGHDQPDQARVLLGAYG